jgi:hypothetical protein
MLHSSREEFFNAYWAALDGRNWPHVVLHSWQDLPERIDSDVDYAVAGVSAGELLRFLAAFCRARNWRLVQIIEHEPGAYYCLCMQVKGPFAWLALDVTWDYGRCGHVLVRSEFLVSDRRRVAGKSFAVPSVGGEFCYLLAKAAAKGKDFSQIRGRLAELLAEDLDGCCRAVEKALRCAIPAGCGDAKHLTAVGGWFAQAPCFRAVRGGRRWGAATVGLGLRRILQPTGFWLALSTADRSNQECEDIIRTLTPVFRRIHQRDRVALWDLPEVLTRLIRTTLVVEQRQRNELKGRLQWPMPGLAIDVDDACGPLVEVLECLATRVDRRIAGRWKILT